MSQTHKSHFLTVSLVLLLFSPFHLSVSLSITPFVKHWHGKYPLQLQPKCHLYVLSCSVARRTSFLWLPVFSVGRHIASSPTFITSEVETLLRHINMLSKLKLALSWVNVGSKFLIHIFAAEKVLNNLECLPIDFLIFMTLKKFDFVKTFLKKFKMSFIVHGKTNY